MRRAVLLTAGVAMLLGAARAQTIQVDKNNRTIAVTANDKASAPADTAVVTVGFQTYAPDAATAYSQGSTLSNAILEALKKAGVADKAVESQDQKLAYTEFPENDKSTPEQRAQKQFTLSQSWTVKAGATDAAKVLHAAIEAGANESGNIDWDLTDRNGLQAQAAEKALVRATADGGGPGGAFGSANLREQSDAGAEVPRDRIICGDSDGECDASAPSAVGDSAAAGGGVGYGVCGVRD